MALEVGLEGPKYAPTTTLLASVDSREGSAHLIHMSGRRWSAFGASAILALPGCSGSSGGGAPASRDGGSVEAGSGAVGQGGRATGTGGATAAGGQKGAGGSGNTGGQSGTGGSAASTGGASGSGGAAA